MNANIINQTPYSHIGSDLRTLLYMISKTRLSPELGKMNVPSMKPRDEQQHIVQSKHLAYKLLCINIGGKFNTFSPKLWAEPP